MNSELELHDSTLSEVRREDSGVAIILGKAIVHHSDGVPGIDDGTCWLQRIDIHLENAVIQKTPSDIPNEIDDGHFTINGRRFNNMIASSMVAEGTVEVSLITFYGHELLVTGTKIAITEIGKPEFLQNFEGTTRST